MCFYLQKTIDVLKIDIEGGEWSFLRNVLMHDVLSNVKQIILEIHSPGPGGTFLHDQDYAEITDYLVQLERLNFWKYHFSDENNCCGAFSNMVPGDLVNMKNDVCCYEIFLINGNFVHTDSIHR